jgi:hypothetical protein
MQWRQLPLIALAVTLAGCASTPAASPKHAAPAPVASSPPAAATPASAAARVVAWNHGGGGRALRRLTSTLGDMSASAGNLSAAGAACGRVSSAVTAAEAAAPMPYAPSRKWYVSALAKYGQAAADCQAGVSAGDAASFGKVAAEIGAGNADMARADAAVRALSG